jgi:hypothetical protein
LINNLEINAKFLEAISKQRILVQNQGSREYQHGAPNAEFEPKDSFEMASNPTSRHANSRIIAGLSPGASKKRARRNRV